MGYNDHITHATRRANPPLSHRQSSPRLAVKPKKKLGQHFLQDEQIAQQIAATVDSRPDLPLLEVGGGMGMLTQYLLSKPRKLCVVDIDNQSVAYLKQRFPNLNILHADFLRMDLSTLFDGSPFVVTGNYPYDIASQIFFKVLDFKDQIPLCTGMIQREMALRLCSEPGNKAYGVLSIFVQAWYDCTYLFTVNEDSFLPKPRVKSAVVALSRNQRTSLGCNEHLFRRIVKTVFSQRRKMLRVSLKGLFPAPEHPSATAFLHNPHLQKRPEQLSIDHFVALTNALEPLLNT